MYLFFYSLLEVSERKGLDKEILDLFKDMLN